MTVKNEVAVPVLVPAPYQHLVLGVFGFRPSEELVQVASHLASGTDAQLHLVRLLLDWEYRVAHDAKAELQELAERYNADAGVVLTSRSHPYRSEQLSEFVDSFPDACVIVPTDTTFSIADDLLGSTAAELIRDTRRPIIGVGSNVVIDRPVEQVVAPLDGTAFSTEILPEAARWAQALRVPLWLVQVINADVRSEPGLESGWVRHQAERLSGSGIDVEWEVLHGSHPAKALLQWLHAGPHTLTALATHAPHGVRTFFTPSVADQLLHLSPGPVVVELPESAL
jgi:nucleotide-binding universal stress UspA family protein